MRSNPIAVLMWMLVSLSCSVTGALSEPAYVRGYGGHGQGIVFRHAGACWIVTAAHILNRDAEAAGDRGGPVTLVVASNAMVTGQASVRAPFWPGFDVAIGVVEGAARDTCTQTLAELRKGWAGVQGPITPRLPFVTKDGRLTYDRMEFDAVQDHKSFDATFTGAGPQTGRRGEAMQGRSGSFLLHGDQPLGMAITNPAENVHGFIRIEEIVMNVDRYLSWAGDATITAAAPVAAPQPAGFDVRVHSSTLEPADLDTRVSNVLTDMHPFFFQGGGEIVFEVIESGLQTLNGVRIVSNGETRPKDVAVSTTTKSGGSDSWLPFDHGVMTHEGVFETRSRAGVRMQRVVVYVDSAWGSGTRRIDQILFY